VFGTTREFELLAVDMKLLEQHEALQGGGAAVSNDYSFSAGFLAKQSTIRTSQRSTFTRLTGSIGGGACQSIPGN
jgi:hypothetical protein